MFVLERCVVVRQCEAIGFLPSFLHQWHIPPLLLSFMCQATDICALGYPLCQMFVRSTSIWGAIETFYETPPPTLIWLRLTDVIKFSEPEPRLTEKISLLTLLITLFFIRNNVPVLTLSART